VAPETGTLRTRDDLELALYRWPVQAPRATCLLVHGYAEHVGRYRALADARGDAPTCASSPTTSRTSCV